MEGSDDGSYCALGSRGAFGERRDGSRSIHIAALHALPGDAAGARADGRRGLSRTGDRRRSAAGRRPAVPDQGRADVCRAHSRPGNGPRHGRDELRTARAALSWDGDGWSTSRAGPGAVHSRRSASGAYCASLLGDAPTPALPKDEPRNLAQREPRQQDPQHYVAAAAAVDASSAAAEPQGAALAASVRLKVEDAKGFGY